MVHLFNKVYLRHESLYDSFGEILIGFSEAKPHPLAETLNLVESRYPAFQDILDEKFEGSIEQMWASLLQKDKTKKVNFFVDTVMMHKILVQYWKSIFKNPDINFIYQIYRLFILDNRLKSFLMVDMKRVARDKLYNALAPMEFGDFEKLYKETPASEVLKKCDKSVLGFEYLLANYYHSPDSFYAGIFLARLKELSWKFWFNEAEILKAEILNAFYDIERLVPEMKVNSEIIGSVTEAEKMIASNKLLSWIVDENFNKANLEYVQRKYSKDIFLTLHERMFSYWSGREGAMQDLRKGGSLADDQALKTDFIFDGKYLELLEFDIKKGFGCIFTSELLRNKTNQILTGYIYDLIRKKDQKALAMFELNS